jgi:uncharacterized protein (DUF2062 family)
MSALRDRLERYFIEPLRLLLRQGMAPRRLALCLAIGIVVGNIPILGTSTVLCTLIALACRLNLPAIQLAQAAMAPTQLLLIIPFVRLGEGLLHAPPAPLSISAGLALIAAGPGRAVMTLWGAIVHAAVAFALVAPFAIAILYRVLTPVLERAARLMPVRLT